MLQYPNSSRRSTEPHQSQYQVLLELLKESTLLYICYKTHTKSFKTRITCILWQHHLKVDIKDLLLSLEKSVTSSAKNKSWWEVSCHVMHSFGTVCRLRANLILMLPMPAIKVVWAQIFSTFFFFFFTPSPKWKNTCKSKHRGLHTVQKVKPSETFWLKIWG